MGRHPEGLAAALQRRLAPTERAVRIRRRRPRGRIVGGWGCRETPSVCGQWNVIDGNGRSFIFREDYEQAFDN
jgi:hypothetical protein